MAFLGSSVRAPLAVLAVILYVLGAITGGVLHVLLRKLVRGFQKTVYFGRPAADWK